MNSTEIHINFLFFIVVIHLFKSPVVNNMV